MKSCVITKGITREKNKIIRENGTGEKNNGERKNSRIQSRNDKGVKGEN